MSAEPRSDLEAAKAAVCEEVGDFYTAAARVALFRAADGFLTPEFATPLELLHSVDLQRQFANAGTRAMQAVQKTAIWQVRGLGVPVSERIRRLWELTDAVQREAVGRLEAEPPQPVTLNTLPALFATRPGEGAFDRQFRIFAALTRTLADQHGWADKFAVLAELGIGVAGRDDGTFFDAMISEILRPPAGLAAVLGREPMIGDEVLRLLALADATMKPESAPASPPTARRLFDLLAVASMAETRAVLTEHAILLIRSNEKFTGSTIIEEIAFVVGLKARLMRGGELLGGTAAYDALSRRLARALSDETIDLLMAGTRGVGERVQRALQLHGTIFGVEARRYLESYVGELMAQPNLETMIVPADAPPHHRIASLGKLYRELKDSQLSARTKDRLANQVERFQSDLLDCTRLLENLASGEGPVADRLLRILELCRKGAFIDGPNVDRAREAAHRLMKRAGFLDSYLAGVSRKSERATRLKDLEKRLFEARVV